MRILITGASGFIGTNLIEAWRDSVPDLLNLDIAPPLNRDHRRFWERADVMDRAGLTKVLEEFQPSHAIHLAGRTDCDEHTTVEEGYRVNTEGAANVLASIAATPSIQRAIITSTQYVCRPGYHPIGDRDCRPHTVYGQSKIILEQMTRESNLPCVWTIVRPVNIWGPWHMRYDREFWRVLRRGLYCHPGRKPVIRTYGYVGNIIWQMRRMLEMPSDLVDRQTFYVGDRPIDLYAWVNGFSKQMLGKPVRVVPRSVVRVLGWLGDTLSLGGVPFPITSSRYRSMTQDYRTPVDRTFDVLGDPPYTLEAGIEETVRWIDKWRRISAA